MFNKRIAGNKSTLSIVIYIIFLVSYILQTSVLFGETPIIRNIIYVLYIVAYIISAVYLLTNKYSAKKVAWITSLLLLGILIYINTFWVDVINALSPLNMILMILCAKDIDFEKAIELDLKLRLATTILLGILAIGGIITNIQTVRIDGTVRYAFGFAHANRFGISVFLIILYSAYLKRNRWSIKDLLLQFISLFIVYLGSNSRSASLGILAVIIYIVQHKIKSHFAENSKIVKLIRRSSLVFLISIIALVFYSAYHYSSNNLIMNYLNSLSNYRLVLGSMYADYYKITPFGAAVRSYTWDSVLTLGYNKATTEIDILYLRIFFKYGVFMIVLYVYILYYNINYAIRRDGFLLFCIVLISTLSIIENQFFSPVSNIFLLIFANKIYGKKMKYYFVG